MVRARLLSPDKVRTHSNRSVLTRAVGIGLFIKPDITRHTLQEGDRIILCSDGVWSVIEDDEFGSETHTLPVQQISEHLVNLAMQRESDDNASVVAFQVNEFHPVARNISSERTNWLFKLRNMTR
jgi:protein phosphatase